MNTTREQNAAHRTDVRWIKTKGNDFRVNGQRYVSEYQNPWNGWAIRKHFGTGLGDGWWYVFDTNGDVIAHGHSLTYAKVEAGFKMQTAAVASPSEG